MIRLQVEEYCHECIEFEPVAENRSLYANEYVSGFHDIVVFCEHSRKCQLMYEHIKRTNNEKTN